MSRYPSAVRSTAHLARQGKFDLLFAAVALLLFGAAVLVSIVYRARTLGTPFFDWQFYSAAVGRWLAGDPIYPGATISTLGTPAGGSYAYPPASVPLLLPFSPYPVGAVLWVLTLCVVLLLGLWFVVRAGWPGRPLVPFGIGVLGLIVFAPVQQGLGVANVNILTAGMLGIVWGARRSPAVPLALLTVLKVFPIALAAPLGIRAVVTCAAVAAGIVLATIPLVGLGAWSDYVSGLTSSQPLCDDPYWFNPSLACIAQPVLGSEPAKWLGVIVGGACFLIALRAGRTFLGMAAATFAVIAPATEVHEHYLAMLYMLGWIAVASRQAARTTSTVLAESGDSGSVPGAAHPALGITHARDVGQDHRSGIS